MTISVDTERAVMRRINRTLKHSGHRLRKTRPGRFQADVGDYYIIEVSRNLILAKFVDLKALASDVGA